MANEFLRPELAALNESDVELLENIFKYHPVEADQVMRYTAIRAAAKVFATVVMANCLPCADRADALRKIREAVMVANASIALKGRV